MFTIRSLAVSRVLPRSSGTISTATAYHNLNMALLRSRPSEIPKDAVILTEQEAIQFQWKMVEDNYGDPLL